MMKICIQVSGFCDLVTVEALSVHAVVGVFIVVDSIQIRVEVIA